MIDIQDGIASTKKGYAKLLGCCKKAAEHGFSWVWIDTCCIDKKSSAELSEAINSMYEWYKASTICYAYLQDVTVEQPAPTPPSKRRKIDGRVKAARYDVTDFTRSRWFTRGWTLQELLAPKVVEFYTSEWEEIGTKTSLAVSLAAKTDIPIRILRGQDPASCSIAQRMSWASLRQTTREEDTTYCLLGLFNVNMPLLYGEGRKAFLRLQELIMKQEEDYTLFAWTLQSDSSNMLTGLLASSPSEFSKRSPSQPTNANDKTGSASDNKALLAGLEDGHPLKTKAEREAQERKFFTFSDDFGYVDSKFKVFHTKAYENIERCSFHRSSSEARFVPTRFIGKEPPELTSRGLRITLPVMQQGGPDNPSVAWLYCMSNDMLLCVSLQSCTESSSTLMGRHAAPWLISVDKSELVHFHTKELLLYPNGVTQRRSSGKGSTSPLGPSSTSWGRLRVVTNLRDDDEFYSASVSSTFPIRGWSLDEFFFSGAPKIMGIVMIMCACKHGSSHIAVCCGLRNEEQPWCSITEHREWKSDSKTNKLEKMYNDMSSNGETKLRGNMPDRAALRSVHLSNTVFTAVIRRVPGLREQTHAYSVYVGAHASDKAAPWVRLYMEDQGRMVVSDRRE